MTEESFGRYRLLSLIGRGGMGEVWRAVDTGHNDRVVALKRLPTELAADPTYRARFQREAAIAASLGDPHVIPIHDYGEIDGRLFIDMRLIEAADLTGTLRERGAAPPDVAVEIIGQVAEALDEAHARGLLHRDVKPSNILVAGRVDRPFVYLIDFGIARTSEGTRLTSAGVTTGTLAYMAPETFEGEGDHRADVYALACVLHETLTGRQAMEGNSAPSYMRAHLFGPIPRPSQVNPGLSPALDAVIATGLAKDPRQRYQRAGDLADAARAALATSPGRYAPTLIGAPPAPPPSSPRTPPPTPAPTPPPWGGPPPGLPPPSPPPAPPRRAGWLIAAALAAVGLVAAAVVVVPRLSGAGSTSTPTPSVTTAPATVPTSAPPEPTTSAAAGGRPSSASVGLGGSYAALYDKLEDSTGVSWTSCTAYPDGRDNTAEYAIQCNTTEPSLDKQVAFYQLNDQAAYETDRARYEASGKDGNCSALGFGGGTSFDWESSTGTVKGYIACFKGEEADAYKIIWGSPKTLVEAVITDATPSRAYEWWTLHAAAVPA